MRNIFLILVIGFLAMGTSSAQDAFKSLKAAEKSIKKFTSNPAEKGDFLAQGIKELETAFASDDVKAASKSWLTKAKIYQSIAAAEFKTKTLDKEGGYVVAIPNAAATAYDSFKKVSEMTDKKNELKEVQNGLMDLETHLNNFGIMAYQVQDYKNAFSNFSRSLSVKDDLNAAGKDSRLDDEKLLGDQVFFTAVSAYYDDNHEGAKPYLEKLYEMNSPEPFVYEALYTINAESDTEAALGYLAKGRELAPDDTALLFAEINHYLKAGETDKLVSKLEMAIEKEPDNVSIYNTLGSVYDQLQQDEKDPAKSQEQFDKAMGYYNQALSVDEKNFDAIYSVGAMYYNKAASYVDVLNELANDFTPAGMKKYDAKKKEMDGLFEQALPHFKKAEGINANDPNTIIALKEIYARLNDLEKSNEYKAKIDAMN